MKNRTLIIMFFLLPLVVQAQNSRILYFMDLPQNRNLNPAFKPADSLNIALPASGFALSLNNNFLNLSDVIANGRNDSLITFLHPEFNTGDFLNGIRRQNSIDLEFSLQLLGLGFRTGETGYLFFDVNEKIQARSVIPGDLFELALRGNEPFAGKYIDLSALKADMKYYHEFGLGYSWNLGKRLRAGVKGKLLLGMISASLADKSLGIRINEDYTHVFDADASINFSAPITVIRDGNDINDLRYEDEFFRNTMLLKGKKNPGVAFDAGVTYNLSEKLELSAALTDVGFIRWRNNVTNLISRNQFEFNGIDMTGVINGDETFSEAGDELIDSLKDSFQPVELHESFTTSIPGSLNMGAGYRVSKNFEFGILSSSRFMGRQLKESLTLSANMNLGSSLLASVSYTASNHRLDNIGAGLALRLSVLQFYIMSDRIPVYWDKIYTDSGNDNNHGYVPVPANLNTFDLRFGMNLVFGHRKKKVPDACDYETEETPEPAEIEK